MTVSRMARHIPALALLLVVPGCTGPVSPDPLGSADLRAAVRGAPDHDGTVSKPFQARLYTVLESLAPDPTCGDPPRFLNTQVGEGTATHLGQFTVRITFCVDATDLLDDGVLEPGESVPYDHGLGRLIAANGDELDIEVVAGVVLPSDHPDYDFEFHDPFRFTGGTGRFAGATGGGTFDSFVVQATDRTTHDWRGTLTLPQ